MKSKKGFTILDIIIVAIFASLLLILFFVQKSNIDAMERDENRNGYYAFTCRKCAPSFGYFGYFVYEKELNERADIIYERH